MPNESDARIIIDRLLRDAGWNIEDKSQVSTEEAVHDGRADRGPVLKRDGAFRQVGRRRKMAGERADRRSQAAKVIFSWPPSASKGVRGKLAIENEEKAVYVRCLLGKQ